MYLVTFHQQQPFGGRAVWQSIQHCSVFNIQISCGSFVVMSCYLSRGVKVLPVLCGGERLSQAAGLVRVVRPLSVKRALEVWQVWGADTCSVDRQHWTRVCLMQRRWNFPLSHCCLSWFISHRKSHTRQIKSALMWPMLVYLMLNALQMRSIYLILELNWLIREKNLT